ncbi:MAG: hypothetical protein JWO48_2286 [Bryobacterales bacterium]|nr:hypothetical protein [Bryobacterales bacterium]
MMVGAMRWTAFFLLPMLAGAAELSVSKIHTVYVLPMAHGLDQYVANQLTREHVFEVIADPARADAIFTEQIGDALQARLEKLHPTPKPPEPKAETESGDDESEADNKDAGADKEAPKPDTQARAPKTFINEEPHVSTLGRGKGTLFLVDAHSRAILWSVYERPKRFTPDQLDRTAKRVVNRLKEDLAGK